MKRIVVRGFALVVLTTAGQLVAQSQPIAVRTPVAEIAGVPKAGADCSGGIISDDGSFEFGVSFPNTQGESVYAMRVPLPASQSELTAACICWSSQGTAPTLHFDLNVWAADGSGGAPGTFLGRIANATVTAGNIGPTFFRFDFPTALQVSTSKVYVGPAWDPTLYNNWFVCEDTDGPGGQPAYFDGNVASGTPPAVQMGTGGNFTDYKALGIRVEAQASGACVVDSETLCLNNNRFKVQATYDAGGGNAGMAHAVPLTGDTGYLWFFASTNVEAVVKVLNGCGDGGHYWVFAGGLTNVHVVMTVTDTQTSISKTYTNPANTTFQPIQDTSAFATCP